MLFNSYIYILIFLPLSLIGYFTVGKWCSAKYAKLWLVACSLVFYSYWNVRFTPILLSSILVNFLLGKGLHRLSNTRADRKRVLLIIGILFNVGLLGYFKYTNFLLGNITLLSDTQFALVNIALPIGISFYTFQQIAFLADNYYGKGKDYHLLDYSLFVSFFPQLIAGPIVHHKEMMPQFESTENKRFQYDNFLSGCMLFFVGLFKKVVVADGFAYWANLGFGKHHQLGVAEAWITAFSYAFQLYYDFSGYTDMALGAAAMFNIHLPVNFNSPYKALNIQDFWRRWHMTLSRWLRDYLYIPLGGSRCGVFRNYSNLFLTFLVGGIWHGAGWTYVIWGAIHGFGMVVHRLWKKTNISMHWLFAWGITFVYVTIGWVFFRADNVKQALSVLSSMFLMGKNKQLFKANLAQEHIAGHVVNHLTWLQQVQAKILNVLISLFHYVGMNPNLIYLILFACIAFLNKNSIEKYRSYSHSTLSLLFYGFVGAIGIAYLSNISPFLYFQF